MLRKCDNNTIEQWQTILLSSTPEPQLIAVRMAEAAARIQGILADDQGREIVQDVYPSKLISGIK